jgi:hypothetical protein
MHSSSKVVELVVVRPIAILPFKRRDVRIPVHVSSQSESLCVTHSSIVSNLQSGELVEGEGGVTRHV